MTAVRIHWRKIMVWAAIAVSLMAGAAWVFWEDAPPESTSVERAWSFVALVGLLLTAWMVADAWTDYRVTRVAIAGGYAKQRGARWWIAVGTCTGNGLTFLIWSGFLAIGVLSIAHIWLDWLGWVLIAMEALLAGSQVWSRFVRSQIVGRPHLPTRALQP